MREQQRRRAWQRQRELLGYQGRLADHSTSFLRGSEKKDALVQLVLDVAAASNEAATIVDALQFALNGMVGFLGWPLGHALLLEGDESIAPAELWVGDVSDGLSDFKTASEAMRFLPGVGLPGLVLESARPAWINDLASHPNFARSAAAERAGLRTALAVPVMTGKNVVGVLEVFHRQRIPPDPKMLEMLSHIGVQLGRVIERWRADEALRKTAAQLKMVISSLPVFVSVLDRTGRVLMLEGKAMAATTLNAQALLGQSAFEGLADRPDIVQLLHRSLAGEDVHTEILSGRGVDFEVYITPYYDVNWAVDGAILLAFDISERKRMEADLEEIKHRLLDSVDSERIAFARQLHDGPLQDLYGAFYQLQDMSERVDDSGQETLRRVLAIIDQVTATVRSIVGDLHPNTLLHLGLSRAIQSHAEQIQERNPEVIIHLNLEDIRPRLPETTRLGLFRVYQQLISNAVTHAQARHIWVRLSGRADRVTLEVQDNGKGFNVPQNWIELVRSGKVGLANVQERVERMNGQMSLQSGPLLGTTIRVTVPRQL